MPHTLTLAENVSAVFRGTNWYILIKSAATVENGNVQHSF